MRASNDRGGGPGAEAAGEDEASVGEALAESATPGL
jgi:hypothetical protein